METVWDGLSVVHAKGVTGERSDHTRSVRTSRARDISLMSISPKSRRSMFGKGGPRPKAQAKTPVLLTGMTSVTRVPVLPL